MNDKNLNFDNCRSPVRIIWKNEATLQKPQRLTKVPSNGNSNGAFDGSGRYLNGSLNPSPEEASCMTCFAGGRTH